MRCIQCGIDNKLRERSANLGRCKACGHPFAFEPKTVSNPLQCTDTFFAKLIQDLSVNNTLFFTEKQLHYLLNRRLEQKANRPINALQGTGGLLLFLGFFTIYSKAGLLLIPFGAAMWLLGWWEKRQERRLQPKIFRVPHPTFVQWLQRWRQVNGDPETLLPSVRPETPSPASIAVSPEVSDYSFDRVVVCQQDIVAHLLIANNLHFEHNCAVISLNGYPFGIFDTVMEMLQRNPNLSVYALHDASPDGVQLTTTLRLSQWFPNPNIAIYDLGLSPRQALAMNNPFVLSSGASGIRANNLPEEIRQSLSEEELNWLLAGNYLELESFGPKKLLQVVSRGINLNRQGASSSNDSDSSWGDSDPYSDSQIFVVSSFG